MRIIVREDIGFSDRVIRVAKCIEEASEGGAKDKIDLKTANLFPCPKCRNPRVKMLKMFYNSAYHIEIDKCTFCGMIWFDKDELEVLKYLIEKKREKSV